MRSPEEIRKIGLRKYPDFLKSIVQGTPFFPLAVRFGKPSTATAFEKLRAEIEALAASNLRCRIEWREVRSPRLGLGRQRLPERIFFDDESDYLLTIGRNAETRRFREQLVHAQQTCPGIVAWMALRPQKVVDNSGIWDDLITVCSYFLAHPRPDCYGRELPLPISTKFIAENRAILGEMLETILQPAHIVPDAATFEERFGLQAEEPGIRIRVLDPTVAPELWPTLLRDLTIPRSDFARLNWPAARVLVVENRLTFVTLPAIPETLGVWGAGHAVDLLTAADWLQKVDLVYWGDLDAAGFQILNRMRSYFPHVRSMCMDIHTLTDHRPLAVKHVAHVTSSLTHLTRDETAAYVAVCQSELRLEQEKLPLPWVADRLKGI